MKKILLVLLISFTTLLWTQDIINGNIPTYVNEGLGTYYDSLVPLGFSREGNFAFLKYYNGDAIAYWSLSVRSLVTDEVLYYQDWSEDGYLYDSPDFKTLLDSEKEFLESIYFKYDIEFSDKIQLSKFPYKMNNSEIDVTLTTEELPTDEYLQTMGLKNSKVDVIVSNGIGSKKIGSYEQHKNSVVFGFIKSPFENRVAVLILKASLGFEGSTAHSFHIYGCNLEYGFK